jgi:hypothetical protein
MNNSVQAYFVQMSPDGEVEFEVAITGDSAKVNLLTALSDLEPP